MPNIPTGPSKTGQPSTIWRAGGKLYRLEGAAADAIHYAAVDEYRRVLAATCNQPTAAQAMDDTYDRLTAAWGVPIHA